MHADCLANFEWDKNKLVKCSCSGDLTCASADALHPEMLHDLTNSLLSEYQVKHEWILVELPLFSTCHLLTPHTVRSQARMHTCDTDEMVTHIGSTVAGDVGHLRSGSEHVLDVLLQRREVSGSLAHTYCGEHWPLYPDACKGWWRE